MSVYSGVLLGNSTDYDTILIFTVHQVCGLISPLARSSPGIIILAPLSTVRPSCPPVLPLLFLFLEANFAIFNKLIQIKVQIYNGRLAKSSDNPDRST